MNLQKLPVFFLCFLCFCSNQVRAGRSVPIFAASSYCGTASPVTNIYAATIQNISTQTLTGTVKLSMYFEGNTTAAGTLNQTYSLAPDQRMQFSIGPPAPASCYGQWTVTGSIQVNENLGAMIATGQAAINVAHGGTVNGAILVFPISNGRPF